MSQALIYTLLALALVLPFVGASALRVFFGQLSEWQVVLVATVVFGIAIASVLVLARSNADSLRIGSLTLLLPVTAPQDVEVPLPTDLGSLPTSLSLPTVRTMPTSVVTATSTLTDTGALTDTVGLTPTLTLTITAAVPTVTPTILITPTVVPPTLTLTATLTPTTILADTPTVAPPAPPPAPRTYTVQPGDTLRSIAAQFNVSVPDLLRANNLTAAQADSLRPGQVLTVP